MAKSTPRNITDVAIDCAIHRLKDPNNGWRGHIPNPDLGNMVSAGSGQIGLQALVAQLHYDGAKAIPTLVNYYDVCTRRFMLSEPWSVIYGRAIINCWASTVLIAERKGFEEIASMYRKLLSTWSATCALMQSGDYVMTAGCRSWGFPNNIMGIHDTWLSAIKERTPPGPGSKAYGKAGSDDDWGWRIRCEWVCSDIYRSEATRWYGKDIQWLVDNAPRWTARTEMQLFGWADGSRLWVMGDDEDELDDEDSNGNTPGLLAAGRISGKIVTAPRWPCRGTDGKTVEHLRQTAVFADIDGSPIKGWNLRHSHLGDKKSIDGYMITDIPSYSPSSVIFSIKIPADNGGAPVWDTSSQDEPTPPTPPDKVIVTEIPKKKTSFFDFLKKLWPF